MEKIILAPHQMHKSLLLNARKEGLFINPKILTKEELLQKYYGRVTETGLYHLFEQNEIIYDNLMQIVPLIPRSNENCIREKNIKLYEYKMELLKDVELEKDEFFEQFIKDREFEIYGYSEKDHELLSLLNTYQNKYTFKKFSKSNHDFAVRNFPLIEDEIFYMLNEIAGLLDKGISPNDIYIYTSNENAIFYLKKYYKSFGFEINFPNSQSLYSQESVSTFLIFAKYSQSFEGAFEFADKFKLEMPEDIKNTLIELCSVDLEFAKKLDYVSSILRSRKIQNKRYENAINIISEPVFEENKYIFIPCFAQNIYPKSYKDNSYISDADKIELNVLTSLEKCRIEDEISRDFLLSNNRFYLSRASAAFNERYFESPFVKLLKMEKIEVKDLPDTIYSKQYAAYRLGIDKDNLIYYLQHSKCLKSLENQIDFDYRTYDNSYTNAMAVSPNDFLKLSYSSVKEYFDCPFKYYLNRILRVNIDEDTFGAKLGTLAHYIFEHQFDDNFDFEISFEEARNLQTWEPGEDLFLDRCKDDIKSACDASILHSKSYLKNPKIFTEITLQTRIESNTLLEGKIDKVITINDTDVVVVDYKTNNESFDRKKIEYGVSLQLPTYAYLLNNDDRFKDYNVAGLYINNVINNSFSYERKDDEVIDANLKLNGVTLADMETFKNVDESIVNGKSFFVKGVNLTKNGQFKKNSSLVGKEELQQMIDLTLEKYLEASDKIRNNLFDIYPLFLDNGGACKYCKHKDICFVKVSQRHGKDDDSIEEAEDGDEMV